MSNLSRIFFIDKRIRQYGSLVLKEITDEFEISDRMARKDIEFMRYTLDAPIVYSKEKKRYYYDKPFDFLNFADEKTLLSYILIKNILKNGYYIPFVTDDIIKTIEKNINRRYRAISENISYKLSHFENFDLEIFAALVNSFVNNKCCRIKYENLDGAASEREIEPLYFQNYTGAWFVIAYCHNKRDLRIFKLARIVEVTSLDNLYISNFQKEEIESILGAGFGIYFGKDKEIIEVKIRFYGRAERILRNQTLCDEQTSVSGVDEKRGKYIEITLPVTDFEEIMTIVLKYGEESEVISPESFKEKWMDKIKKMYSYYVAPDIK